MKHRWIVSIALVCLCATSLTASAKSVSGPRTTAFWNAAELQRRLSIGRPWKELTPFEEREHMEAVTYLWGVADAIEGDSACVLGAPNQALNHVVLAYMADNSISAEASAADIVKLALSKSFPCSRK